MTYIVHDVFLTIQGEGANLGRVAVFVRFAGCNLWSGREEDRAAAICKFCDTEFRGGTKYAAAAELADRVAQIWPVGQHHRRVVLTGGEPLLQTDASLVKALRDRGFWVAVETNGTQALPCHLDWVCVSPKANAPIVLTDADELKLVYPQRGLTPEMFDDFSAVHRWLSPMAGRSLRKHTGAAAAYCQMHPAWRLNIQAHKAWAIP